MPKSKSKLKLKSHRGASKRFRKTASGQYKHTAKGRRHYLHKKSTKQKRHLRAGGIVDRSDVARVDQMLPMN